MTRIISSPHLDMARVRSLSPELMLAGCQSQDCADRPSRVVSLAHFATLIKKLDLNRQSHTGVVSGSKDELELRFVQSDKVTILSFENDKSFNLDQPWFDLPSQNFSLTFCNQILEHVFNPHLAFRNLIHHTIPGGHIYVTISHH